MIEDALRLNYISFYKGNTVKLAASDYEPRICAIDVEHGVLKSNKLLNIYKSGIMKLVGEIKRSTNAKDLHSALVPKSKSDFGMTADLLNGESENIDETLEVESNACDKPFPVFTKASDLIKSNHASTSKSCTVTSSESSADTSSKETFSTETCDISSDLKTESKMNPYPDTVLVKKEVPKIKYFFEQSGDDSSEENRSATTTGENQAVVKESVDAVRFSDDTVEPSGSKRPFPEVCLPVQSINSGKSCLERPPARLREPVFQ